MELTRRTEERRHTKGTTLDNEAHSYSVNSFQQYSWLIRVNKLRFLNYFKCILFVYCIQNLNGITSINCGYTVQVVVKINCEINNFKGLGFLVKE